MKQFVEVYANNGERIRILIETDIEYSEKTCEYDVTIMPLRYTATWEFVSLSPIFSNGERKD